MNSRFVRIIYSGRKDGGRGWTQETIPYSTGTEDVPEYEMPCLHFVFVSPTYLRPGIQAKKYILWDFSRVPVWMMETPDAGPSFTLQSGRQKPGAVCLHFDTLLLFPRPSKGSTSPNSRYSGWVNRMTLEYSGEKLANSVAIFLKCGQPLTSSAKPHQAQVGPILLKIYLRLFFLLSVPQPG